MCLYLNAREVSDGGVVGAYARAGGSPRSSGDDRRSTLDRLQALRPSLSRSTGAAGAATTSTLVPRVKTEYEADLGLRRKANAPVAAGGERLP